MNAKDLYGARDSKSLTYWEGFRDRIWNWRRESTLKISKILLSTLKKSQTFVLAVCKKKASILNLVFQTYWQIFLSEILLLNWICKISRLGSLKGEVGKSEGLHFLWNFIVSRVLQNAHRTLANIRLIT